MQAERILLKIVLAGDTGVGKTSILTQLTRQQFQPQTKPTIGVAFMTHPLQVRSITVSAQLWDLSGQERFRSLCPMYFRGAAGAILLYDISNPSSFKNIENWLKDIQHSGENKTVCLLIGNKRDLESQRAITYQQGEQFALQHHMRFIEATAKEGTHLQLAMETLVEDILKQSKEGKKGNHPRTPQL